MACIHPGADDSPRKKLKEAARRLVGGGADETSEALNAFGITPPQWLQQQQELEIWPENWQALTVFRDMATSWVIVMGAVTGLRWETLPVFLSINQVPRKAWRDLADCLRVMEAEALQVLNRRPR